MGDGELYLASLLEGAVAKVPQARDLRDFLWTAASIGLRDIVDHVVTPSGDHARCGWTHVAPGVWRNLNGLPALRDGDGVRVALRVDDIETLLAALGLDSEVRGAAHTPFRQATLFEAEGVAFDAVERCGWTGFEAPEVNPRQLRRARIYRQTLATRRRAFRDPGQGYVHLSRLLEAAVADLGAPWASGVFVRAELDHWRAQCSDAHLLGAQRERVGVGWSDAIQLAFTASRANFQRAAGVARMLGYRQGAWIFDAASGAGAQRFECPLLARPALIIECDGPDAPAAPLVEQTWLAAPGLWSALHGEGMLEGGARAVSIASERVAAVRRKPVAPARVDALERERYLSRNAAEDLRLNGAEGPRVHAGPKIAPYTQLAALQGETAPPPQRQRHRVKRQA
ncbi:hypothetical protein [Terricaulis sp.]|uniref:hypothetical protein n=1 Tax=Terricaulis sp. TaxID=2768686 RepID=UPI0037848C41